MTMADRIAIIADGRLQQVGRPQDVYDRPGNLFVAGFIGSPPMNVLAATARVIDGEPALDVADAGRMRLGAHAPAGLADGRAVMVGVRPEHLHVDGEGLEAAVAAVEWLGHERHLVLRVGASEVVVRERSEGAAPDVGSTLRLRADPDELHLFDPATGERLG
jgi:multiple sugar transport system ATP-binding protein